MPWEEIEENIYPFRTHFIDPGLRKDNTVVFHPISHDAFPFYSIETQRNMESAVSLSRLSIVYWVFATRNVLDMQKSPILQSENRFVILLQKAYLSACMCAHTYCRNTHTLYTCKTYA